MAKLPRARPASENERSRAPPDDPPLTKKEIPDGWRDALLSGDLAFYAAVRITDFIDGISLNIALAIENPGNAAIAAAVSLYDTAGSLWDTLAPAVSAAASDINKKLFEEGWFGREVTARDIDVSREPPTEFKRMSFRELMDLQNAMLPNTPEQARDAPEHSGPDM